MPPSKSDRTRQSIIEGVSSVFHRKGFLGTSLADVEVTTGLSRGAIYGHFKTKEDIALTVFDYNFEKVCAIVSYKINKEVSFYSKILVFARVHQFINSELIFTGGSPVLYNTWEGGTKVNTFLREKAIKAVFTIESTIIELLRQGIEHGEFRLGTNAKKMAQSILSVLEGGLVLFRIIGDLKRMSAVAEAIEALLSTIKQ